MSFLLLLVQLKQCSDEGTVSLVSYTNKANNASDRNPPMQPYKA